MKKLSILMKNVKKAYGSQIVLKDVSLNVPKGSIFALLGENGAGKTTTVKLLSTLIKPDNGIAEIEGYDCVHQAQDVRSTISVTGQYATIDEELTGEENLQLMAGLYHLPKKVGKQKIETLLEQFDLVHAKNKLVKTYSGGMRRRLDIAVSLLPDPKLLFLDEPTTGLDPRSRKQMWELIKRLASKGMTIFLTTQYLEEADQLADTIAILNNGEIVATGTANDLKSLLSTEQLVLTYFSKEKLSEAYDVLQSFGPKIIDHTILLPAEGGITHLRYILNILFEKTILPDDTELRKPTLDDVFMKLTEKGENHELGA